MQAAEAVEPEQQEAAVEPEQQLEQQPEEADMQAAQEAAIDAAEQGVQEPEQEACKCDRPACKEGSCRLDDEGNCGFYLDGDSPDGTVCGAADPANPCDADDVCSFGTCVVKDNCGAPGCSGMAYEAGSQVCAVGGDGREKVCCGSVCQSKQAMCKKAKGNGRRLFGWW
jgi:hypothetical protein